MIYLQNKCVPYWPDLRDSKKAGPYVVTCESEREAADYKVRVLEIALVHKVTSEHLTAITLLCVCTMQTYSYDQYFLFLYSHTFFSFAAKTLSYHLALPVHELA